jgi:sugar lactone lactonase YvrE
MRRSVWPLIAGIAAGIVCALFPPQIAFEPYLAVGLGLVTAGTLLMLLPGEQVARVALRSAGGILVWGVILWCALSQPIPLIRVPLDLATQSPPASLTQSPPVVWCQRGAFVVFAAAIWGACCLPRGWQLRTMPAVLVPTILLLSYVGWVNPPHVINFQPGYLAVDHQGALFATDLAGSAIRVFGPDGSLRAKLWPALASWQGPPGPGFSPPGPASDPERLGVPANLTQASAIAAQNLPPTGLEFHFCGIALDTSDRLVVPDTMNHRMLQFSSDGRLVARWSIPVDYAPAIGCVATGGASVFLADQRGAILAFSSQGNPLNRWTVPEPLVAGIAATADGAAVFALTKGHVYRLDTRSGATTNWALPTEFAGPLSGYQALLVQPAGRVLMANNISQHVEVRCVDGSVCGAYGMASGQSQTRGDQPGQLGQLGGLAQDADGRLYVADVGHRVIQRFTASGHIDALYWSIADDEAD